LLSGNEQLIAAIRRLTMRLRLRTSKGTFLFMQDLTFEQLVDATMRLQPELRQALVHLLGVTLPATEDEDALLQTEVLNEAGAFSVFAALPDEHPHNHDATEADLLAAVQCLSSEWEEEPLADYVGVGGMQTVN
jgi:hypothetical protein